MAKNRRFTIFYIITAIAGIIIFARLFSLQIVQGESYSLQAQKRLMRNMPSPAPRGEILDRYGRPLVTNRMGFSVIFQNEYIEAGDKNNLILRTINLAEQCEQEYIDTFPLTEEYPFSFAFDTTEQELGSLAAEFKEEEEIDPDYDANQTFEYYKKRYDIPGWYSYEEARKVIGVRYEMEKRLFNNSNPYTFASDVNMEMVTGLEEMHADFKGVNVMVNPVRETPNGSLAAHILGRVGIIYAEEYAELEDKGYSMHDTLGKDGLEKYLESYLKGKDGVSSIEHDIDGKMSRVIESQEAVPGNYAVLTIDSELQKVLEDSLARTIAQLKQQPETSGISGGSAVVIDVNSGEVLAIASYPTYDPKDFNKNYQQMINDPDKPMWNRAISGQYAPGSTFKILTAVAGLEEGVITPTEVMNDTGVYTYYREPNGTGYQPHCWYYDDYGVGHGGLNVTGAIEKSCNYYFYETGRRLTIDGLVKYGKKFGLGEYTGIELSGEAKGVFASKEYKESTFDEIWYPGDTLQAAIGQSYHLFTPVQLANYIATVVNGGTRYKVHLVKSIKSYEDGSTIEEIQPEVMDSIEMSDETYRLVMDGMRKVSESGTASNIFSDYHTPVGGKTGTASVSQGAATGLFVAFAPFDNPEIAISIVVEHGAHGNYFAAVARDVFDAYLRVDAVEDELRPYNQLIQ